MPSHYIKALRRGAHTFRVLIFFIIFSFPRELLMRVLIITLIIIIIITNYY